MKRAVSLDIGSTWTKAALIELDAAPRLLARASAPTASHDLTVGAAEVLGRLLGRPAPQALELAATMPLYLSSSAKGGLALAAVGIVPDLTQHAARLAAASAGAKIVAHFAYRLTAEHIAELRRLAPDIILLAGGTDGGSAEYNRHNARMLAAARLPAVVLYAGNAAVRGPIAEILADRALEIVDNVMPEIGVLAVEPARSRIQEIFLRKIVEGKGLAALAARCVVPPKPTPRAVFELLEAIAAALPDWDDTLLVDMGGATTDVYSCTESFVGRPGVVLRGLCEPRLKRSVEGDLGMRVNVRWAAATGHAYVERELAAQGVPRERFEQFIDKVSARPEYLPRCAAELACDEILAGACLYYSLLRHAGSVEESYTPDGRVFVQRGKDLRRVRRWVGSGGYLAQRRQGDLERRVLAAIRADTGSKRLVPDALDCYADADYLWPLLGNLAADYPAAAAQLAVACLVRIENAEAITAVRDNRTSPLPCLL